MRLPELVKRMPPTVAARRPPIIPTKPRMREPWRTVKQQQWLRRRFGISTEGYHI